MTVTYLSLWKGEVPAPPKSSIAIRQDIFDQVLAEVCAGSSVRPRDLVGDSRLRPIVHKRQEAMYRLRKLACEDGSPRYSLPVIGDKFGGRDHTTVLHGVRAHAKRLAAMDEQRAAA